MATTTPNFGWPVPTSTDLVKDGAVAIEALGDAVDASLLDLKGGTTGQVLSKTSNTDMDFTWVAADDTNAIQNAIVDAKGDLIAATANDTPARLAVGANGETLVADSSTATGLKWAKSPNFVGCSIYKAAIQAIPNNTTTAIVFDTEAFDTDAFHSTTVNNTRITIPTGLGGKYLINTAIRYEPNATGYRSAYILINAGASIYTVEFTGTGGGAYSIGTGSKILDLAAGDYIQLMTFQNSGGNLNLYARYDENPFSIQYLGA